MDPLKLGYKYINKKCGPLKTMSAVNFVLVCLASTTFATAYSDKGFKTPRQPVEIKLNNKQHLLQHYTPSDPVNTEEMDDVEGIDLFFGSDVQPWDESPTPNDTMIDNVWLPFSEPSENATETITLITNENNTNTLIQDFIESFENLFSNPNATADFVFITHIQLPPHSCPSDATRHFDEALRTANPNTTIASKAIRSGSTVCNPDCPCPSKTRHLATKTVEIRTASSASTIRMPSSRQFPMDYEVVSYS
jgi:hypothetical protein